MITRRVIPTDLYVDLGKHVGDLLKARRREIYPSLEKTSEDFAYKIKKSPGYSCNLINKYERGILLGTTSVAGLLDHFDIYVSRLSVYADMLKLGNDSEIVIALVSNVEGFKYPPTSRMRKKAKQNVSPQKTKKPEWYKKT